MLVTMTERLFVIHEKTFYDIAMMCVSVKSQTHVVYTMCIQAITMRIINNEMKMVILYT